MDGITPLRRGVRGPGLYCFQSDQRSFTVTRTDAKNSALVLFSGGQDSATCVAWALARYDHVETIGFDYGQRHKVELDCRARFIDKLKARFPHWAARLGDDHVLDLGLLGQVSDTALTAEKA